MRYTTKPLLTSLSVPNVWARPNNMRKEADAAKALLTVPGGDHLTLLNVYNTYRDSKLSYSIYRLIVF